MFKLRTPLKRIHGYNTNSLVTLQIVRYNFCYDIYIYIYIYIFINIYNNYFSRPSVNKTDERKRTGYFAQKLLHAFLGRCGIGLGLANVSLGLFMAQSNKTIWIVWFSYLGFILICYFFAEISQSRSKMADKIDNEQYIVKDIVPASELPRQWFDRFNKCEESL